VNYLLDTHVLLWLFLRSRRLPRDVLEQITDPSNVVYASAVSTWEISIKAGLGKLTLPGAPASYLPGRIERAGLTALPILPAHTYGVFGLPAHHNDPFDRLLIAQAQTEALTLITADATIAAYDVRTLLLAAAPE